MPRISFFGILVFALTLAACQQNAPTNAEAPATNANTPPPLLSNGRMAPEDSLRMLPNRPPNPWQSTTCDLLTDAEFYSLFGVEEKRDFANRRSLDAYCLRAWKKPDWREREVKEQHNPNIASNAESALTLQVFDFGKPDIATAQFNEYKTNKKGDYSEEVPGLGDGAVWSDANTTLWIRKGQFGLQIKLDHADQPHDNLSKAIEVAKLALAKMK